MKKVGRKREKHAVIYVARSKKKDIRFFCTWWSCPSSRWDWTSVGSWCCGWAAQVEKNKDLWKNSQLCLLTWSGRKKETGLSFYYFYKDMALGEKISTLLTWSGGKETGFGFITFIRICEKNSELYFLDPEEKKPDSVVITFIRICEKIQNFTWSGRERPDSVFITFIMICEKIQNFTYLIRKKETRFSFYYFYSVLLIWSGSWSVWNPLAFRKMLDIIRKKLCFTWRPGPSSW